LRKHVLEYDDVMNKHREVIYKKRREILEKARDNKLREQILEMIKKAGLKEEDFVKKEKEISGEKMREVEKVVALRVMDMFWLEHLENMEYLSVSVRLRAYGQRDPLVEYKSEGHKMFQKLVNQIELSTASMILSVGLKQASSQPVPQQYQPASQSKNKPGRNDPCPCGSNKKYKKCCYPKYG